MQIFDKNNKNIYFIVEIENESFQLGTILIYHKFNKINLF